MTCHKAGKINNVILSYLILKMGNNLGNYKGKWVWYYKSGKVEREINYLDDMEAYSVRDGKSVYYDQDGNITDQRCYLNDVKVDMSLCE